MVEVYCFSTMGRSHTDVGKCEHHFPGQFFFLYFCNFISKEGKKKKKKRLRCMLTEFWGCTQNATGEASLSVLCPYTWFQCLWWRIVSDQIDLTGDDVVLQ
uniref:Uncharacterized protein n=1 Tax=Manihot esculenta TaxID=3983 RepID=A0A2C9UQ29_MANES